MSENKLLRKVFGPTKGRKNGVSDITNDKFCNIHNFNHYYQNNKILEIVVDFEYK